LVSVLDFVNRVRTLQGLGERVALPLLGTEADDEHSDAVASALGVPVGESEHPQWAEGARWVMRFPERRIARDVGMVTGLDWLPWRSSPTRDRSTPSSQTWRFTTFPT
jgi:hypothetical protein